MDLYCTGWHTVMSERLTPGQFFSNVRTEWTLPPRCISATFQVHLILRLAGTFNPRIRLQFEDAEINANPLELAFGPLNRTGMTRYRSYPFSQAGAPGTTGNFLSIVPPRVALRVTKNNQGDITYDFKCCAIGLVG